MRLCLFYFLLFSFSFTFSFSFSFAQNTYSTSADSTVKSYISVYYRGTAWISKEAESRSCQYNLVNVIDSFLYVQVNVAGIEIGRAIATPCNILFINKLEKQYYQGDYVFFKHFTGLDVDFYTLQAIVNDFPVSLPEEIEITYSGERFSKDEYSFFRTLTGKYDIFEIEIGVKKVTFNKVPEVSATIPKNCIQLFIDN
ncbi:MAG: DUF4292 domain-containing protein [Bacteroidales bacterium]|jgi:hypothetical protein|nr:DUF4292 domain-containing protein [Bacteroidales bacterium]